MKACAVEQLSSFDELIEATHSANPSVRKAALKEFCPCHVKKEIELVWDRIFEMITDEDAIVRDQVVHSLCDGSPKTREDQVISALETLWNDPSEKVRKRVRRALTSYRRTGQWNIF